MSIDCAAAVFERASWHMVNRHLVLKHWQPNMQFSKDDLAKLLIWVKLQNVPLEYWITKGLSYIASAIGIPIHADLTILMFKRLNYATICIEIDASKMLITEFDLLCPNGMLIAILVEYGWLPSKCSGYNVIGHTLATCPNNNEKHPKAEETKGKHGVMGTSSTHGKQNQFNWQEVVKQKKDFKENGEGMVLRSSMLTSDMKYSQW